MEPHTTVKKQLVMDGIHYHGQDVSVGMEGWVSTYAQQSETLSVHDKSIAQLEKTTRALEQQVKAMAHVMANSNLHNLKENFDEHIENMRIQVEKRMEETKEEIVESLRKEVFDFAAQKNQLTKRIDGVEERLSDVIVHKSEEAANHRTRLENRIEKFSAQFAAIENHIQLEVNKFKDMANALSSETKKAARVLATQIDEESQSREKAITAKSNETERALTSLNTLLTVKCGELQKHIDKLEFNTGEHVRSIKQEVARESDQRTDLARAVNAYQRDSSAKIEIDLEAAMKKHDLEVERRTASIARFFPEIKMAMEAEKSVRAQQFEELKRGLAQEKKERDLDDHRIMAMIKSTLTSIQKMHIDQKVVA
eukprot:TRINITY_DN4724_c0_g1_i1.p1 TRINITY_DN4724_c0_g1~~TRINITY_DN4724_c0_g1_i1.p1  ORF type:complete len:368 (+),score=115.00 TRINITY_DN4724_c0_g1_i1:103-1206(+)